MKGLRSRLSSKKVFLLSGFPQNERKELGKKIKHLGGIYLDCEIFRTNCTHIICGKQIRSEKFLGACATGKWIVAREFLDTSFIKNTWVNEEKYEWQTAKRWRTTVERNSEYAFKGWKVAVLAASHDRNTTFKRLLSCGGAELYTMSLSVKNPGNVASKVTYIFTEGKAARTLYEQGLLEYGVLLLKPEFIAAHLLQTSADPMDYLAVEDKDCESGGDFQIDLSQESQDSSHSMYLATKDTLLPAKSINKITIEDGSTEKTPLKLTKSLTKLSTDESRGMSLNCKSSNNATPSRLSQSSLQDFFNTSRRLSVSHTPLSLVKTFSQVSRLSESCSPSDVSQLFQPRMMLDFQKDQLLSVKPVVSQQPNVTSDTRTSQNLKPLKTCHPDETPTRNGVRCSAKRKLIDETQTLQNKQIKKRHPEKLWKSSFVKWTQSQSTNTDSLPVEFSESLASLIEICVDENNYLAALDLTSSMLTTTKYPQPRTIHVIITNILENASTCHIAQKAFGVLMNTMNMHPPTSALMQSVYLSTFRSGQDDSSAGMVWNYISHVISNALAEIESEKVCRNYQLLLHFITSLLEWNFSSLLLQNESSSHSRLPRSSLVSCMLAQVMWSPSFIIVPNSRTRALLELLQDCLLLGVPFGQKQRVVELLLSLVSMTAHCCHLADRGLLSDIMEGNWRIAFVFELARKLTACCVDEQVLQVILRHLQPAWLCLRVCQILLGAFDDHLLQNKLDSQQISLGKIVTQYFFLLPRLVLQKGQPSSQTESGGSESVADPRIISHSTSRNSIQTLKRRAVELKTVKVSQSTRQSKVITKHLLSKVNKRNAKGESILHRVCIKNDTQTLRELLQVPGIDVNIQDYAGWTPLHEACNHGHVECVDILLKWVPANTVDIYFNNDKKCRKVDLLLSTPEGITPLHDAVSCSKLDVCRLLLKYGGIQLLKSKTSHGLSPVDLAQTAEMKTLLSDSLQWLTGTSSQSSHKLVSSQEMAPSHDSQHPAGSHQTNYVPSDFLYEQVLATDAGAVKACVKDCVKYVTLITFLLDSYISATGLLLKHRTRTPKKRYSLTSVTDDSSQEMCQNSNNLNQKCMNNGRNIFENLKLTGVENIPVTQNPTQKGSKNVSDLQKQKHKWVEHDLSLNVQWVKKIKSGSLNPQKLKVDNDQTGVQVISRQSHRLKIKHETRALWQKEANFLPQADVTSGTETAGKSDEVQSKSETQCDFYHLRKMKHHLKNFETHLQRITNVEEFKMLESKLACLKCFSILSLQ